MRKAQRYEQPEVDDEGYGGDGDDEFNPARERRDRCRSLDGEDGTQMTMTVDLSGRHRLLLPYSRSAGESCEHHDVLTRIRVLWP
ncbi:unnamed protein product [Linum trigynum]|uniref:Uncharacterized protein n=1 Tax=Linum trigynum TaxID=586398 RepID=A0AAV2CL62_9ROSI